jgi:hypothetical protein
LRREIAAEAATDNAIGSVRTTDFSPRDTKLVSKLIGCAGLGDECHLFSTVKLCILRGINTLDLDEGHTVVLVTETSLESQDGAVNVKARRPLCLFCHFIIKKSTVTRETVK